MTTEAYPQSFYAEQSGGSVSSAEAIVPFLMDMFDPRSVVDIGCGVGGWLASFRAKGVVDILGIDGAWVDSRDLMIPEDRFLASDLTAPIDVGRVFDLCLSLEVAEHLDAQYADGLVASLVSLAPIVVFSAAIPGQTGVHHVNEQWQSYWAERFRSHRYVPIDCIRPRFWRDRRVSWWYAQNAIVYVQDEVLGSHEHLRDLGGPTGPAMLDVVHPQLFEAVAQAVAQAPRGRHTLVGPVVRRLRRRWPSRR